MRWEMFGLMMKNGGREGRGKNDVFSKPNVSLPEVNFTVIWE